MAPRIPHVATLTLLGGAVALAAVAATVLPEALRHREGVRNPEGRDEGWLGHRGAEEEEGHAMEAMEWWYGTRAFPHAEIPKSAYYEAWRAAKSLGSEAGTREVGWQAIGPDNVGGRALALAIDPENPNVLWCGTASGGLWKSTTGGAGAAAWTLIDTGFPTLSVSSILIQPSNPAIMYIGTGEMGRYGRGQVGTPGARDAYGLGVLKSTDHGVTWRETGLTWTLDQSRVVFAITMDGQNPYTLWAATSEGLYKTMDGGANWTLSHASLMAMDVVVDPRDGNRVWVSHGQLNGTPDPGIYRSTDGGVNWTMLGGGLPTTNFGRTPLSIWTPAGSGPATLFAGVSDANTRQVVGLYKSTDDGTSWTRVSSTNWASSQAWYDNAIAVKPGDVSTILCAGLEVYRSTTGGGGLSKISRWDLGYYGVVPAGGPEGPSNYVHADAHAVVWSLTNPQTVYVACDGGVFKSTNNGTAWAGLNGGLQTTQYYAGLAVSSSPDLRVLGGLQDNGSVLYTGSPSWSKVFGGDGGYCGIAANDPDLLYEEYVYLDIYRSFDAGDNWSEIYVSNSTEANFIAPFVVSDAAPQFIYAGTRSVLKSTNGGNSFAYADGNSNWNGTPMAVIGVSVTSPDTLLAATGSSAAGAIFEMRRSTNAGASWTVVSAGLPNLFCTDITFHPTNGREVWCCFSGFGAPHVWKSTNAGLTWSDRTGNLPNIPAQSIAIDPDLPGWIYVGTDLGVFRTTNDGAVWADFNNGMPLAMITDLVRVPGTRLLRAATFGNGVYERDLPISTTGVAQAPAAEEQFIQAYPNPLTSTTHLRFRMEAPGRVEFKIVDASGRVVSGPRQEEHAAGEVDLAWDGRDDRGQSVPAGVYYARIEAATRSWTSRLVVTR